MEMISTELAQLRISRGAESIDLAASFRAEISKSSSAKLKRTNLYIPLTGLERFGKGVASGCDAVIFDLEDSVPFEKKNEARANLAKLPPQPESVSYGVRVNNGSPDELEKDLAALDAHQVSFDFIVLAKVERPEEVERIRRFRDCELAVRIETPLGVEASFSIASLLRETDSMGMGAGDLTEIMGIDRGPVFERPVLVHSFVRVASAAHQYGASVIDMVTRDINPTPGSLLEQEARWAKRELGASGKMVIHPKQIAIVNQVFTPEWSEICREIELLNKFASSVSTRAVRATSGTYGGGPSYRTAVKRLKEWVASGVVTIG